MRIFSESYKIPAVLIVIGGAMCIVASLDITERFTGPLFYMGAIAIGIGVFAWALIQISKYAIAQAAKRRILAQRALAAQASMGRRR